MFKKTQIRRIIEFFNSDLSVRQTAQVLHVSRNVISDIQVKYEKSGYKLEDLLGKSDDELYGIFYPDKFIAKQPYANVDYGYVHSELKKTGVTLKLLWEEYVERCKKEKTSYCSYATFARNYTFHTRQTGYTSAIKHRPGETVEVDWAGKTMFYTEKNTGKNIPVYLFVATMPYSQYVYVEATEKMGETE